MARIRTIKPEFFTSADIVSLTPLSRLFYVSMWCESDREGRLAWNAKTMKLRYFPGDNCDIEAMTKEIVDAGLVVLYEVDGKQYAEIPSFKNHQVINNRESESVLPPRVKDASERVKAEGRKEGKGRDSTEPVPSSEPEITIPTNTGEEFPITQEQISEWKKLYPGVDVMQSLREMRGWSQSNPTKRKTSRGLLRFVNGWLSREQNTAKQRQSDKPFDPRDYV